ncbi:pseudouridine synthase [Paenibacillus septentrionalis]|uniref:Pseudouridine synthase n=1 Tax=Paenibacillus septentrionalis TaxID=429342 RepID=A0ABW1V1X0_9BACL
MSERLRLDKLLAHAGFGTRSEIKKAVKAGRVYVNDQKAKDSGHIVDPDADTVTFDGELVSYRSVVYLMMNKPQGVISATEDGRERTVIDLLQPEDKLLKPFPVGRLDKDTTGLLLLTNDGQLAHELLSPKKHVDKTYEAYVLGHVTEEDQRAFEQGVALDDGYITKTAKLIIDSYEDSSDGPCSWIRLTITEGKFHQVKRMFQSVGKQVLRLNRLSMGPLELDQSLERGQYRELTEEEVEQLKQHRSTGKS